MAINAGPKIVEDGLVFCVDAANPRSYPGAGTTWTDLTANKDNGSLINTPTFDDTDIKNFTFNGTNEYAQFTGAEVSYPFPYDVVTAILWVFPLSSNPKSNGTDCNLITIENSWEISIGNRGNGYSKIHYASNPWAWRGNGGNHLVNDQWNMLTFVHSLTDRKVYVDNQLMYTYNDTGALSSGESGSPYLRLMNRYCCGGSYAPGKLSYIMIYNRALSASEVLQNYNATKWRFQ